MTHQFNFLNYFVCFGTSLPTCAWGQNLGNCRPKSILSTKISASNLLHHLPLCLFRYPALFIARRLQPAFPYFLHSLTASAANTSGFLQVSLSKIRGDDTFRPNSYLSAADFR